MRGDARSSRVALVPDALLGRLLADLEATAWGVMQLPPEELDAGTAALWLEQTAEHVAEFRRNDYRVVLVGTGAWEPELEAALGELGEPVPPRVEAHVDALRAAAAPSAP